MKSRIIALGLAASTVALPSATISTAAGNAGPSCNFDPSDDGSQAGLNPALIYQGDVTVQRLVNAIHASKAWREETSTIVVAWDENDYSLAPNINQVVVIVDTNYGHHGVSSAKRYNHFSLLKSLEGAFELPGGRNRSRRLDEEAPGAGAQLVSNSPMNPKSMCSCM